MSDVAAAGRDARRARHPFGRKPLVRPRARRRGDRRPVDRRPAGDRREPAHGDDRHAGTGGPDAPATCGRRRADLRPDAGRGGARRRARRRLSVGGGRAVRASRGRGRLPVPSRPRAGHGVRGPFLQATTRHPSTGRRRAGASLRRPGARRGCASLPPLPRGGVLREGVALRDRRRGPCCGRVRQRRRGGAVRARARRRGARRHRPGGGTGTARRRRSATRASGSPTTHGARPPTSGRSRCRGGHPADVARLGGKIAALEERGGRYDDAIARYDAALEQLGEAPETLATRAGLELGKAGVLYRQARYEDCVIWAGRASANAEAAGDRAALAHALYLTGSALTELGRDGIAEVAARRRDL